ncbi:nuclear transport factor 2 family protein [Chryseobacterium aquaticum]|uniref:Nuclear transport factor 2 family protein n=1 Tax=Chryseobacterium aquaticum TaxID=452084 RepID=A0A848N2Z5_9FLAO|nr:MULTISPECIES: nuclear transport factor 2 family protein [Chryseobacterium]NMR33235.1 nuclear transport factor 2 family protein [Chryseobacterium aquaticum]NRQ44833.1 nuclear transport factor 2 family protein [Chryseobacterium sp. C-204]
MKALIFALILTTSSTYSFGQQTKVETVVKKETKSEQEVIQLSKDKWDWMSAKDSEKLDKLFDEKSVFVHMGGSWGKKQELDVIKSGGIWYKKADIHDVSVNIIDNTAIILTKMDLLAVVGGNEVTNPFIVTEVFVKKNGTWQLGSLSFTKTLASSGK